MRQLASKDAANTVIATRRSPASATALTELAAAHPNLHVVALDVLSEDSVAAAVASVKVILGPSAGIDYLINNAGIV